MTTEKKDFPIIPGEEYKKLEGITPEMAVQDSGVQPSDEEILNEAEKLADQNGHQETPRERIFELINTIEADGEIKTKFTSLITTLDTEVDKMTEILNERPELTTLKDKQDYLLNWRLDMLQNLTTGRWNQHNAEEKMSILEEAAAKLTNLQHSLEK